MTDKVEPLTTEQVERVRDFYEDTPLPPDCAEDVARLCATVAARDERAVTAEAEVERLRAVLREVSDVAGLHGPAGLVGLVDAALEEIPADVVDTTRSDVLTIYDWAQRDGLWAYQPDMGAPGGRRLLRPSGAKAAEALLRLMAAQGLL